MLYIIYKITCKTDETLVYVGSTSNYNQRISTHKYYTNNIIEFHNYKIYISIRDNGGWDNWSCDILESIECETRRDAIKREFYYVNILNANLNEAKLLTPEEKQASIKQSSIKTREKYYDKIKARYTEKRKDPAEKARIKAYSDDYHKRRDVMDKKNERRRELIRLKNENN